MKKLLVFLTVVLSIWACAEQAPNTSSTNTTINSAPPDGSKIYKRYCVTCHGLYGDMGASGAHDLSASTLQLSERITVITNGRNGMTPFESRLSAEQIKAVAQYTLELTKD